MDSDETKKLELKLLIQKRGRIKASVTRFSTFLKNFNESKRIIELQARLSAIEVLYSEFDNVQSQIELISPDSETTLQERESFENHYFDVIASAKEIICKNEMSQNQLHNISTDTLHDLSSSNLLHGKNIKLPMLDLPKFYGDYDKWLNFRDTFTALIHSDKTMHDVTKFHYLNSCLKGAAEQALSSLEVTGENYEVAWGLLCERFENKKVIKRTHLKTLIDWPPITRENHLHLRKLLDGLLLHLKSLKSLGEPVDEWDTLIIYIFSNKLDSNTNREWENFCTNIDTPKLTDFTSFLSKRCQFLESLNSTVAKNKLQISQIKTPYQKTQENRLVSHVIASSSVRCYFCKDSHYLYKCKELLKLPVKSRLEEVKKLKLCTNCLRSSHTNENCTSGGCKHCGRKHNSILHFGDERETNNNNNQSSTNICADLTTEEGLSDNFDAVASVNTHCAHKQKGEILLSTALVDIQDKFGNFHKCRVLLDSGSQSNFIRKDLCNVLQINKIPINIPVAGISQMITNISYRTNATIRSRFNTFTVNLPFLVLDKITENLPVSKIDTHKLQIPNNIVLADPSYHVPGKIDLLIGASVFFELLSIGQIKLGEYLPVLQKTKLGWVISGCVPSGDKNVKTENTQAMICNLSIDNCSIQEQIEKFWRLENVDENPKYSQEETQCEEHFLQTTNRDEDGHFVVKLPLRDNTPILGDSYQTAIKRFEVLERKLAKNEDLKIRYNDFMQEYHDLGHMTLADTSNDQEKITFYLPHHGVIKETSTTTKLRVVFDASAKSDTGISLNDKLKVGPTVQEDLFSILLRFRKHKFVIVADIEKMYRQVFVQDEQRDLQRILWKFNTEQPIQHYRLNTLTYGTASAAFLATRCLRQAGIENQSLYPEASKSIVNDFYVDDLLTGTESVDSAKQLIKDLINVLNSYGFPLRKWISNSPEVLEEISLNSNQSSTHFISNDKITKTLGLLWNSETDIFQYTVNFDMKQNRVTKRVILSVISQLFDPLGLVGPVIIKAKIILQRLWQLKLDWDEAIPADLHTTWTQLYKQIHHLNHLKIPRHVICFNPTTIQLHSFCDSSEQAYGSCIYLRSTDSSNNHNVRLLCAKSRVAPLKKITLPRLELCGALLSAQLTHKILKSIDIKMDNIFHWCDSTITLAWIHGEPNRWKTFVANRVSEIQELTEVNQWRHVDSNENPSDIISRGVNPEHLSQLDLWWYGPQWLAQNEESWPQNCTDPINVPETKNVNISLTTHVIDTSIFDKFSSLTKLQRIIALCIRFMKNVSTHTKAKIAGPLSSSELNESLITLIKLVHSQKFPAEIHSLKRSKTVSSTSKLASLNPFLDDNGLIRVGGRLKHSDLSYNHKHPIILPSHHPFTKLVILHEHFRHLHAGAQATLCAIRNKYWPLNGRSAVRGVLRRCITCFKAKPYDTHHQMGQLPDTRIKPCRPFSITGIDFAGPFYIKDGKYRNRKIVKCYLCLFVCFVTRAVHLELTPDLSTNSFLNALKRMVSRRGLCNTIYSDNGSNFIGANNELNQLHSLLSNLDKNSKFREFINQNSITWNFIPPKSPHFGGIWEAAVKSAKHHLKRILGNANLTYEEFYTVLTQVEAVLNSRPLTPLSNDPNDLLCLTPGHFLIGEPLNAIPQDDVKEIPNNRLSQYKRLQQLVQHFWARWSHEYLSSLHPLTKWKVQQPNGVRVGSMVLLKDENTPPLHWKIGRICDVFPGQDGIVRVVNVKTTSGIFKRGVRKICVLPIET